MRFHRSACILILLTVATTWAKAAGNNSQTLRWMGHWKNEGFREQLVLETLENFRFVHQDIHVTFEFATDLLPEKSQICQASNIVSMIHSGNIEWDVIWLDPYIYAEVAAQLDDPQWGEQYLFDFSTVPSIRNAHRPDLLHNPSFCQSTGGILTGPCIEGFVYCMWYNTQTAKTLGVTIPEEDMTFDELIECLQRINTYNQSATVPIYAFSSFRQSGSLARLAHNLLTSILPESPTDDEILQAQKRTLEAIEQIVRLCPPQEDAPWNDAVDQLADDQALFLIDSTWRYNALKQYSETLPNKIRPAQVPGFQKQSHYCGGFIPAWALFKNSPARDAGIELMKFWCRPAVIEKWVRGTKNPSGITGSLYDPVYGNDPFALYQQHLLDGRSMVPDLFMNPKENGPAWDLLKFIDPIRKGKVTARAALDELKQPAQ